MTTTFKTPLVLALMLNISFLFSQNKKDSLGLPGDNFDLYGALELFKQAKNPEAFEKAINSNDNEVNNLDLNADGKVDYVKVLDKTKDNAHAIVLQVAVSKTETQDVAVIEIEKSGSENAHVQIVGDEELYGKNYIIEPKNTQTLAKSDRAGSKEEIPTDDVYNTAKDNNNGDNNNSNRNDGNNNNNYYSDNNQPVVVNVWAWPSVQYVYTPAYVGWVSPYYWGYYPGWWQPWQPVYYPIYYRRVYRYHQPYYYRTSYYRFNNVHNYYYGHRSASETVRERNRSGYYRDKQAGYKNNPVQGRKYNSLPAEGGRTINRTEKARENDVRGTPAGRQPSNQGGVKKQDAPRAKQQPNNGRSGRNESVQNPKQVNPTPRSAGRQQSEPQRPQQVTPQQRERTQPNQVNPQPRPQQQGNPGGRGASSPRGTQGGGGNRSR
ncbi:MAG: hypothetical protein V4635_16300 [Bacteroidota bacterium]